MKTYYVEGNVCYLYFSFPPLLEMPEHDLEVNIFTCKPEMIDESKLPGFEYEVLYKKISSAEEYELPDRYVDLNVIIIDSKESEEFIDIASTLKAINFVLVHPNYHLTRDISDAHFILCWDNLSRILYHAICAAFYSDVLYNVSNAN
ncbi:hypothetical protein CRN79_16660 [Serratia fonticola]|uniref:hypothetical protein n=1 Tax=Serratia fonticola TaxID=47917 RepID=UPI000BFE7390|nr:hypothetical protein [Serratia fonticola]ATM77374.1 hypothetical protein CRN79_16660 [Serratia fonticola]